MRGVATATTFGELRSHPGRALVAVVAIAIGVAMAFAIHLINDAATGAFAQSVRTLMGKADLEIRGTDAGFAESVYPRVARLPGVAAASPAVVVRARLPDRALPLTIVGIDVFRAARVQPGLIGRPARELGRALPQLDSDAIFLSPAAMRWLKVKPGQSLQVEVGLGTQTLKVMGALAGPDDGQKLGVMDIGAAQWRFHRLGTLQRIDLRLRPGTDVPAFRARLARLMPAGVHVSAPAQRSGERADVSRAYRVNLAVLALIALFTGAFLVFSSQALAVMGRRGQFALLRALGLTRSELLRQILAEAALQGVIGAVLGIALGYLAARATLAWAGGDLGAGYFKGIVPQLHFDAISALLFGLLGVAAATLGSLAPARQAARTQPAQALRAGDEETALQALQSPLPGVAAIVCGVALSFLPAVGGLPIAGYLAIALMLIGAIALMPRLAETVFPRLPKSRSVPLFLATTQLGGAPGRAAIALAGILASFSLMVAMATMVTSFRTSFDRWLDVVLPADLYLRAADPGETAYFSVADQRAIATTPGIRRAEFEQALPVALAAGKPPVVLLGRDIDPRDPGARIALIGRPRPPRPGEPPPVWVSEAVVDLYGYAPGQRIRLPIGGRWVPVTVDGVWRDYARQTGAIVIERRELDRLTGDRRANEAALWFAPGSGVAAVERRLRARLPDRVRYSSPGEIRTRSLRIFDRSFAVTYLLEAVAIVIGLAGIAVSFGGQALARVREFGMLRHIGVGRRQVAVMLATEGVLLAMLGVAAGGIVGSAVALVLIHVVNPQSFHWSMSFYLPWRLIGAVALVLIAASAATAAWAGRRAMGREAVSAVREDW